MNPSDPALEHLLVRLLHHVFERMPGNAVVKGGFQLRLLDCPRNTNDLDVVLVPYGSKKFAAPVFREALEAFPCSKMDLRVHSTAIRALVTDSGKTAQVEASVAEDCPSVAVSTASLAAAHRELPRIVRMMRFDVALSHKIGAWLERGLQRDLYDIFYWSGVQKVQPHADTLVRRLGSLSPRRGLPEVCTRQDLVQRIAGAADTLDEDRLRAELSTSLPEIEFQGLVPRMRGVLTNFAQRLELMGELDAPPDATPPARARRSS